MDLSAAWPGTHNPPPGIHTGSTFCGHRLAFLSLSETCIPTPSPHPMDERSTSPNVPKHFDTKMFANSVFSTYFSTHPHPLLPFWAKGATRRNLSPSQSRREPQSPLTLLLQARLVINSADRSRSNFLLALLYHFHSSLNDLGSPWIHFLDYLWNDCPKIQLRYVTFLPKIS